MKLVPFLESILISRINSKISVDEEVRALLVNVQFTPGSPKECPRGQVKGACKTCEFLQKCAEALAKEPPPEDENGG